LKVLAPSSIEEVEKKIEELRERERLFERGCQEEQISETDSKLLEDIKSKKTAGRSAGQKKVEAEEEFPTI
jgi:septum formation inhibitor MinC